MQVELREVAYEVIGLVREAAKAARVRVASDVRACEVAADRGLLRDAVRELTAVAIAGSPQHAEVTIDAVPYDSGVLLRVIDRVPSQSHSRSAASCQRLEEAYSARVWVEALPVGAAVCVWFPSR